MCFVQVPISELSQKQSSENLLLLGNISAEYCGLIAIFYNIYNV